MENGLHTPWRTPVVGTLGHLSEKKGQRVFLQAVQLLLAKGLDAGTAFDILSIDIADVDVGENVGAKLEIDRAQAKKQVAQADAEKRAAEARASQAEQEARISEMRAKVVEAESQIPMAIAEAFRSGNMGIMDYYRMNNIKADTDMRTSIGGGAKDGAK